MNILNTKYKAMQFDLRELLINLCRRARERDERWELSRVRVHGVQPEVRTGGVEEALVVHDSHASRRALSR